MATSSPIIINHNSVKTIAFGQSDTLTGGWSTITAALNGENREPPLTPGTLSAIAGLQEAMRLIVQVHENATDKLSDLLVPNQTSANEDWSMAATVRWVGIQRPVHHDILVVAVQAENPAVSPFNDVLQVEDFSKDLKHVLQRANQVPLVPPFTLHLGDVQLEPARNHPNDLWAQVDWILIHWADFLSDALKMRLLRAKDRHEEETRFRGFGGPGPVNTTPFGVGGHAFPAYGGGDDPGIRFSKDQDWMRRLVMVAKHTYVWLDQLTRRYGYEIRTLDAVPDEELEQLAKAGVTGIWLIGIWERSRASQSIKQRMGDHEAMASAYSIWDYVVADAIGGPDAADRLAERAWRYGIRIGADMVPNHVSLDGKWVAEHPNRFIQLDAPPFPGYSFNGPNLSHDDRMEVHLEDGYWNQSDAAVVFRHRDRHTGQVRYIYHGNDGTQMPWNDTAQLDYTNPETREAVIQSLLNVARRFPIIRLDAAMTLARKHVQRLWFPPPGGGGAIPSRAEHGLTQEDFGQRVPREFWVEVVD